MKKMTTVLFAAASSCAFAVTMPSVSNVQLEQLESGRVNVTYDLGDADGIVTIALITNGVVVSGLRGFSGDVARLVTAGTGKTITWVPLKSWPEGGRIEGEISARVTAWPVETPPDYMVVSLDGTKTCRYYECEAALPDGIGADVYRSTKMVFRKIPASCACFRAGSPTWEAGRKDTEALHFVTLTNDFYLGVFPVTQGQYLAISGPDAENPSSTVGINLPVDNISGSVAGFPYSGVTNVCDERVEAYTLLSRARAKTGFNRLFVPTQAQWEFACRAGSDDTVYDGQAIGDVAWYADNSDGTLQPVGQKRPNAFGLYDMLGNVCERTRDSAVHGTYTGMVVMPFYAGSGHGSYQCMCGGRFSSAATAVRCAAWEAGSGWQDHIYSHAEPGFGIRLAIPLK